jgi:TRAP-type C4-dicarboxylate transport system permease small subunit
MRLVEKYLILALRIICGICFLGIMISMALQVLTRYVFEFPLTWTEESSRFLLIWMVFLGSVITLSRDENIRLTLLSSRLSGRSLQALFIFVYAVILVFNVLFAMGSYRMARLNWELPALTIPGFFLGYLYIASGISAVFIILITAVRLVRSIRAVVVGKNL